ncbi:MAG: InlB B-repeat-containing protein [Candidatus Izemoplasmatales bacterium]|jgi:uncharacterized repeat protein (TIGR02543 family)|nr:InlB B-repeat-containing protein [Candidatus Izemoplasmatales bacterium]
MKRFLSCLVLLPLSLFLIGCGGETTTQEATTLSPTAVVTETYNINFVENGGESLANITFTDLNDVETLPIPQRVGYEFGGWFSDSILSDDFSLSELNLNNLTLYAKWNPINYTIKFITNGGNDLADLVQGYGSDLLMPANPVKQGYVFSGWYSNSGLTTNFTLTTMPLNGMTIYAKWEADVVDVTIKYYTENIIPDTYSLLDQETVKAYTDSTYQATARNFNGFGYDGEYSLDDSSGTVMPDGSLVLELYYERLSFTISFEANATISIESITALFGETINNVTDPYRIGYEFIGWFADEDLTIPYNFTTMPFNNITIYAKWQGLPSVIYFNTLGGLALPELEQDNGSEIELPTPIKDGFDFVGWYSDSGLNNLFAATTMPIGGATLYAKWEETSYSITFLSNGGEALEAVDYIYGEDIDYLPNATKTGYIFVGWYLDSALLEPFNLTIMPNHDLVVYAKWLENTSPYSILSQIRKADGDLVEVEGIVYALHDESYDGYYIYDETGYLYISAPNIARTIGEKVRVIGNLDIDSGRYSVVNISSVVQISLDNLLPVSTEVSIEEFQDLTFYDLYKPYTFTGMIYSLIGETRVVDIFSLEGIYPYYKSGFLTELDMATDSLVDLSFVLQEHEGNLYALVTGFTVLEQTDAEKLATIETIIENYLLNKEFIPGDRLELDKLHYFSLGEVTVSVGPEFTDYLDNESMTFQMIELAQDITLDVTVLIGDSPYELAFSVHLEPIIISTIAEMLGGVDGDYYQIQAQVVSLDYESNMMVLKDSSASVFASALSSVAVGDLAIFKVRKESNANMVFINKDNGGIELNLIISRDNSLNSSPNYLDYNEVNLLDLTNPAAYGQYTEIRGFILVSQDDSDYMFNLVTDDYSIPIYAVGHGAFERLFEYEYSEVIMRSYIYSDGKEELVLFYDGIRNGLRLPVYTDAELVDAIEQSIYYRYDRSTYYVYESFIMYPYHPVMGGEVIWEMDSATESIYDSEKMRFNFTDVEIDLNFTITIDVNGFGKTLVYNATLVPVSISSIPEVKASEAYMDVYVQGVVVYWHPYLIVIQDEFGNLLPIENNETPVSLGTEILVHGTVYQESDYSYRYVSDIWQEDLIVKTISIDNPINLLGGFTQETELYASGIEGFNKYTTYIELTGKLVRTVDWYIYLETQGGIYYIDYIDEYTYYELERYADQFVTIKALISSYDLDYNYETELFTLLYLGNSSDISTYELTELEQQEYIRDYMLANYQRTYDSQGYFDFTDILYTFANQSITYSETSDLIDLSASNYGQLGTVIENTEVTINVEILGGTGQLNFSFTITILPEEKEMTTTPIIDLIADGTTAYMIQGQVITVANLADGWAHFMIEDESGLIEVLVSGADIIKYLDYTSGFVGQIFTFTGKADFVFGKKVFTSETLSRYSFGEPVVKTFSTFSLAQVEDFNYEDSSLYGLSVEISGTVIVEFGSSIEFYLTDGFNKIRITDYQGGWAAFPSYEGLKINLKGFIHGLDSSGNPTVVTHLYDYDDTISVELYPYTDQEACDLVKDLLQKMYVSNDTLLNSEDYISYYSAPAVIQSNYDITVIYNVIRGMELVSDDGDRLVMNLNDQDYQVEVEVIISVKEAVAYFTFTRNVNGFALNILDDLFAESPDLTEIALEGYLIAYGFGYAYFLIENEIYYLDEYVDTWGSMGDKFYIVGKKSVIDGVSDYTYQINVFNTYENIDLEFTALTTDVTTLYTNDYSLNPLQREYLKLYGTIGYDPYLGYYTLTSSADMVYIRQNISGYETDDLLIDYLGEEVYLECLLSMEVLRDEFYLVDLLETGNSVTKPYLTPEESVNQVMARIMEVAEYNVYSGDNIFDYFPSYDYEYDVVTSFGFLVETDTQYIDLRVTERFNYVSDPVYITLIATLTYQDGTYWDEMEIDIKINPLTSTSIVDFYEAEFEKNYQLEGIVVGYQMNGYGLYDFVMIDDGEEIILAYLGYYETIDFDTLAVDFGDEIVLIGERDAFDTHNILPVMNNTKVLKVLSSGNVYTKDLEQSSFADILGYDYLDPFVANRYIEITAIVQWNGSTMYPAYFLVNPEYNNLVYNEEYRIYLEGYDYDTFDDTMNVYVGQKITVKGYLIGYESYYEDCSWIILVDEITVVAP